MLDVDFALTERKFRFDGLYVPESVPPNLLLVVPVRQQMAYKIVIGCKDMVLTPPAGILEYVLSLLGHGVDDAGLSVIDEVVLVLLHVALFEEADNVDPVGNARHELGDKVALDDVSARVHWKDPELVRLDVRVAFLQGCVQEAVVVFVVDSRDQFVDAAVF